MSGYDCGNSIERRITTMIRSQINCVNYQPRQYSQNADYVKADYDLVAIGTVNSYHSKNQDLCELAITLKKMNRRK